MDKKKLLREKRPSIEWQAANFDLQHAVVRGTDKIELDRLRAIRDSIKKYDK